MTHPGHVTGHNSANPQRVRMQAAAPTADDDPKLRLTSKPLSDEDLWDKLSDEDLLNPVWVHQRFPPSEIFGVNARHLLRKWLDAYMDPSEEMVGKIVEAMRKHQMKHGDLPALPSSKYWHDGKAKVLLSMVDAVTEATSRVDRARMNELNPTPPLEMVGLIDKASGIVGLESGSSAVRALGVVAREIFEDDRKGSLREKVEEQYGKQWSRGYLGRTDKRFGVFAIKGLACGPGLNERSARVLLSKIEQYAHKERKMVVVRFPSYISSSGTDLTNYYLRLGFEKLEMDDRMPVLVYDPVRVYGGGRSDKWAADKWVDEQQIMVRMNLLDIFL